MNFDQFVLRLLGVMQRRAWLMLCVFFFGVVGVVAGAYLAPRSYESSAKLLVTLETRRLSSTLSEVRDVKADLQPDEVLAAQVELIRTRSAIEQLLDELPPDLFDEPPSSIAFVRMASELAKGAADSVRSLLAVAMLIDPPNEHEARVTMIEKRLEVFPIRKAQIIVIAFSHKLSRVPPKVIEGLISIYQRRYADLVSSGGEAYSIHVHDLNERLAEAETELARFQAQHEVYDFEAERSLLIDRIDRLNAVLRDGSDDPSRLATSDPSSPPQFLRLRAEIDELMAERSQMLATFTEETAPIRRIDGRIKSVRSALEIEREALSRTLGDDRARLLELVEIEPRLNQLRRRREIDAERYRLFVKAAQDRAAFANPGDHVAATLIDAPVEAFAPKGPNRLVLIAAGVILAVALSVMAALLVDWIAELRRLRRETERAGA